MTFFCMLVLSMIFIYSNENLLDVIVEKKSFRTKNRCNFICRKAEIVKVGLSHINQLVIQLQLISSVNLFCSVLKSLDSLLHGCII